MIWMHGDLVVRLPQVDLGTFEFGREIRDKRKRVPIIPRSGIEAVIVSTGAKGTIGFWNAVERRGPRGV